VLAAGPTWTAHLPWVLLGLRAAPHEEDNISPAQAVFGTPIVLPGQFPGTAARYTDRAAATAMPATGQTRPVTSSGGAV
jgi:hypothetical protein